MSVNNIHDKNIGLLGLPYIIKQALGNTLGNIFLIASAIAITVCCLAVCTACIRMLFAWRVTAGCRSAPRWRGCPGALASRSSRRCSSASARSILLALNIANQSAFLTLTSVAIIMFYLPYLAVTGAMLMAGGCGASGRGPSHGPYFTLGRWGLPINIFAVVYGSGGRLRHRLAARGGVRKPSGTSSFGRL